MTPPPLRSLGPELWIADRPLRILGFVDVGTRTSVARLPGGGLWVHSPGPLDAATRRAVEALGAVRFLVAPNRVHHLYAGAWKEAFPGAALFGAPGLSGKRRDLAFDGVLGDRPDPRWADALDQAFVEGAPPLSEVVFLHRPSRTLLLTDLCMNVRSAAPATRALWYRLTGGYGRFGPNRVVRLCVRDRAAVRRSLDRVLDWDFDRVSVTHGDVLEHGGREALRAGFAWL